MKKMNIFYTVLVATISIPLLFVHATDSSNMTSGSTSSGSTSSGGTSSGGTSSGGTSSGSTNSPSCDSLTGSVLTLIDIQKAYLSRLSDLLNSKKNAYEVAFSYTGSARVDAIKAANRAFREGRKVAQKELKAGKRSIQGMGMCKQKSVKSEEIKHNGEEENEGHENNGQSHRHR